MRSALRFAFAGSRNCEADASGVAASFGRYIFDSFWEELFGLVV